MGDTSTKVSWQMLAILAGVFVYTTWGAMQLGGIQQQVISTSKEIEETKTATATLAAQATQQQLTLALADVALREQVARLETVMNKTRNCNN